VLLVIYGDGGHRSEMSHLLSHLTSAAQIIDIVSLGVGCIDESALAHYPAKDVRHKHNRFKSLALFVAGLFSSIFTVFQITRRFKVTGVISTGPGLCIVPMVMFRLLGVKTVFVETFCRFNSQSFTGRVMCKVAHRFLVQNKEQLALYPNAQYCGRL
jgi:beta-1,4-N-acetylglucosaminyltransferase